MKTILVINGPNLNLLGERDPAKYGKENLDQINNSLIEMTRNVDVELVFVQSNSEGTIIDEIQAKKDAISGLIINPGALTHYSYALRDALEMQKVPIVEVHLSNIHSREDWRKESVTATVADGVIAGFQGESYRLALTYLLKIL